jgi:hypothetical protein
MQHLHPGDRHPAVPGHGVLPVLRQHVKTVDFGGHSGVGPPSVGPGQKLAVKEEIRVKQRQL